MVSGRQGRQTKSRIDRPSGGRLSGASAGVLRQGVGACGTRMPSYAARPCLNRLVLIPNALHKQEEHPPPRVLLLLFRDIPVSGRRRRWQGCDPTWCSREMKRPPRPVAWWSLPGARAFRRVRQRAAIPISSRGRRPRTVRGGRENSLTPSLGRLPWPDQRKPSFREAGRQSDQPPERGRCEPT